MKPYCVVKYTTQDAGPYQWKRRVESTDPSYVTTVQSHESMDWHGEHPNTNASIFWHDTEREAHEFAQYMCTKHPSNTYVALRSLMVVRREPGPEKIAIFNEKGLMPK